VHGHRGVSAPFFRDGAIRFCARASRRKRSFFSRRRDTPTRASRRKRPFFSRRRDTPTYRGVKKTKGGSRGPFSYPAITLYGHRGVSAPFFRDGAIPFFSGPFAAKKAKSGSRGPFGYPAITLFGHRGVSAPFFRDGAIPFFSGPFAAKKAKSGSRGPFGYPAITLYGHRGVSAPSFRDGAIPFLTVGSQSFVRIAGSLRLPRDNPTRASRRKRPFFSRRRDTLFYSRIAELRHDRGVPSVTPRLRYSGIAA